jgi:hypothetical protein
MSKRWDLSDEYRNAIVRRLMQIVLDSKSSPDEIIKATRVLIQAENQNRVDEQNGTIDDQRQRIVEIVDRIRNRAIGVNPSIGVDDETGEE